MVTSKTNYSLVDLQDSKLKTGVLLRYTYLFSKKSNIGLILNISRDHNFGAMLIVLSDKNIVNLPLSHIEYKIL